jgi:hypothetical protein
LLLDESAAGLVVAADEALRALTQPVTGLRQLSGNVLRRVVTSSEQLEINRRRWQDASSL